MKRRDFLKISTGFSAVAGLSASCSHARPAAPTLPLKKAVKIGMVQEDLPLGEKFRLLRELGFDGVELNSPNELDRDEVLRGRDDSGLEIHGVVDSLHWRKPLSDPDPSVRAEGLAALQTAIADARAYGASTVLLVPAVVTKEVSYDEAYRRSQEEIRKVLPLAEQHQIKIAIENVSNQFLLSPLEFARYLDEFDSPWMGAYFDVGNVIRIGWPEQWIRILGKRILKLDIKDRYRDRVGSESRAEIGEGDCNWPAIREALQEIGYQGWATAEVPGGDRERLRDIARRMDQVLDLPSAATRIPGLWRI